MADTVVQVYHQNGDPHTAEMPEDSSFFAKVLLWS